jgi:prepilin-type N-terminal cleavage/methylation domain-containing protein
MKSLDFGLGLSKLQTEDCRLKIGVLNLQSAIGNRKLRRGYTLLEVLLASVIALVLLGALYAALNLTLVRMDASRSAIVTNDLSRAVFNRMTTDIANTLGPLPPKSGGDGMTGGASGSSTSTTTATGTATTGATGTTATGSATTTTDTTSTAATSTTTNTPFGAGVVGTDKQATFFLSKVPTSLTDLDVVAGSDVSLPSDMRRVTYYLASDNAGLCRQEKPWVTADGVWNNTEPDRTDEASEVIAPEVKDITFEYYDGGTWQSTWDGSATDTDGVSLIGPPRAVRITLVLEFVGKNGPVQKTVRQVIPIRAAVGNYTPTDTATTTTTTTPGGM